MIVDTKEIRLKWKTDPLLPENNNKIIADLLIDVFRLCTRVDELESNIKNRDNHILAIVKTHIESR